MVYYEYGNLAKTLPLLFGKLLETPPEVTEKLLERCKIDILYEQLDGAIHSRMERGNYDIETYRVVAGEIIEADATFSTLKPHRLKECAECGRIFYDISRNGRGVICHYDISESLSRNADGTYKSTCQVARDNRKARRYINKSQGYGFDGYVIDGSACSYSESTRERLERELFLWYSPTPDDDDEAGKAFAAYVDAAANGISLPKRRGVSRNGNAVTNRDTIDRGGGAVFRIDIASGKKTVENPKAFKELFA